MHAVKLERPPEAAAGDRLHTVLEHARRIDEADRQAGQEDKRLGAVREAEVPRSPMFERIAGNVIDQDRNQHGAPPEVDVADAVRLHFICISFAWAQNGAAPEPVPTRRRKWSPPTLPTNALAAHCGI